MRELIPSLWLAIKVVVLIAVSAFCTLFLVWRFTLHKPRPWRFALAAVLHAVFVLLVLTFWLNGLPGSFDENAFAFKFTGAVKEAFGGADPLRDQGVDLILIDNSRNKMLVPDPDGAEGDNSVLSITDRARLAELFNFLADHQDQFSLVVCDILFDQPSPADSALNAAIGRLAAADKVILAQGPDPNQPLLRFNAHIMGDVTTTTQKGKVVWYELLRNGRPSLPYLMYARTAGITTEPYWVGHFLKESKGDSSWIVHPDFIPAMDHLSEEAMALPGEDGGAVFMGVPGLMPRTVGGVLLPAMRDKLLRRMTGKAPGVSTVVFIGEFGTSTHDHPGADVHATFQGDLHGSTILLDLYLELLAGAHRVKCGSLMGQLVALLVMSLYLFLRPWKATLKRLVLHPRTNLPPASEKKPGRKGSELHRIFMDHLVKKLKDLLPTLALLACFITLDLRYRDHVNLGALFAYFLVLGSFFQRLRSQHIADHAVPKT